MATRGAPLAIERVDGVTLIVRSGEGEGAARYRVEPSRLLCSCPARTRLCRHLRFALAHLEGRDPAA